jgi:DNA-binding NarL/FixJ family response regulator
MENSTPLIAIYDEDDLLRELLHTVLERYEYQVAFSCSKVTELHSYLHAKTKALLIGGNGRPDTLVKNIRKVKKQFRNLKIVVFAKLVSIEIKKKYIKAGADCVVTECNTRLLVSQLDTLCNYKAEHNKKAKTIGAVSKENAFYAISLNKNYISILKCLDKGLSSKLMESTVKLPSSTIDFYIKKMCIQTHSHNRSELLGKAKDAHVI